MTTDSPTSNDKQQDSVRDRCPDPRCSHQTLADMASGPSPLVPGSSRLMKPQLVSEALRVNLQQVAFQKHTVPVTSPGNPRHALPLWQ